MSDTPITFGVGPVPLRARASLSSSPMVLTRSRRGDAAEAGSVPPRTWTVPSNTLVTTVPDSRSNQSFPMMPLSAGIAPLSIAACPTAVTVG